MLLLQYMLLFYSTASYLMVGFWKTCCETSLYFASQRHWASGCCVATSDISKQYILILMLNVAW